jgi:hypothetical protein
MRVLEEEIKGTSPIISPLISNQEFTYIYNIPEVDHMLSEPL